MKILISSIIWIVVHVSSWIFIIFNVCPAECCCFLHSYTCHFFWFAFVLRSLMCFLLLSCCVVVNQEKREVELRNSIEGFSKHGLRHSTTEEKNSLPDAQSMCLFGFICLSLFFFYCFIQIIVSD